MILMDGCLRQRAMEIARFYHGTDLLVFTYDLVQLLGNGDPALLVDVLQLSVNGLDYLIKGEAYCFVISIIITKLDLDFIGLSVLPHEFGHIPLWLVYPVEEVRPVLLCLFEIFEVEADLSLFIFPRHLILLVLFVATHFRDELEAHLCHLITLIVVVELSLEQFAVHLEKVDPKLTVAIKEDDTVAVHVHHHETNAGLLLLIPIVDHVHVDHVIFQDDVASLIARVVASERASPHM